MASRARGSLVFSGTVPAGTLMRWADIFYARAAVALGILRELAREADSFSLPRAADSDGNHVGPLDIFPAQIDDR